MAPVVLAALLVLGAWVWMGAYTRHNVKVKVPDLKAMTFNEAADALQAIGLQAEVIDSVYSDEAPKGTVVDQDPDSGRFVKPDRTVYLVLNASQPKMLNMPALVNLSKRQAISVMEILGLKVAEVQYKPDPCLDCTKASPSHRKAGSARVRRSPWCWARASMGSGCRYRTCAAWVSRR
ncbi:MAG TPA: PASTA domain-containing protein [Flavobacteriales bacterium]|nr:PASTA domain-containing protein [Flavobacteriales bacterium]